VAVALGRRQFALALTGLACLSRFPFKDALAHQQPPQQTVNSGEVQELYRRAFVIDANAGPPLEASLPLTAGDLEVVSRSGVTAVKLSVSGQTYSFEQTVDEIAYMQGVVEAHPTHFLLVRTHSDLARAKREGKLGLILAFEHTEVLGSDLARLQLFRRLGILAMQLTYNRRSLYGDGCLEPGNAGLSNLGREAVARMNELGIALDLSHCGAQTTFDGILASKKPVLISHSGCNAVYRHPRNKDDRELRAMAERGGVIGIYMLPFLGGGPVAPPTLELLLRHIEYALKVCGADHVGIGSDLSLGPISDTPEYRARIAQAAAERKSLGIGAPDEERPAYIPELNNPRRLEGIALAMQRRGHSPAVIEKVIGANFYRVLGDIW
jgi:membrane dipeptidase